MEFSSMFKNNIKTKYPIIQGGMGIGYSNYQLAGNVSKHGGLGVISSAGLDRVVGSRLKRSLTAKEAAKIEVEDAKKISSQKPVGINIMVAVTTQYEDSVLGAMDGGVDVIISGAGLPLQLPEIANSHPRKNSVALVPIVSSGRALRIIIKKWSRFNRVPDAVIVEGPLAGGHIGWADKLDALKNESTLENLAEEVLVIANKHKIPVIAAGGIHDHQDIKKFIDLGCVGVQMGTRFLATFESGASEEYKKSLIACKKDDIILANSPGSPCGLLFRVIKSAPFYEDALKQQRKPKCDKGYVLRDGVCKAQSGHDSFCICNGLLASSKVLTKEKELYSVGARAFEIDKIISVESLMRELSVG